MRPSLHLQRQAAAGYWKVHGLPLLLVKASEKGSWWLKGTDLLAEEWVAKHRLTGLHPNRAELSQLLEEILAQDPLPGSRPPALRRRGPGLYLSACGRVRVERECSGWKLMPEEGWSFSEWTSPWLHARTLALAAERLQLESEEIRQLPIPA